MFDILKVINCAGDRERVRAHVTPQHQAWEIARGANAMGSATKQRLTYWRAIGNMDSFEAVVAAILQRQGYWTQTSVKVELTKAEKVAIKRPSSPRWQLDVVGYRGASNELAVIECKSYLDSTGVSCDVFAGKKPNNEGRYKLFFDDELRRVVLGRLVRQFTEAGFCANDLPDFVGPIVTGEWR